MPRPVHFEIHAADPERTRKFYETLFGWTFSKWGDQPYWLIKTGDSGPGINGGMVPRMGGPPTEGQAVNAFVCTVDSPDLDATTKTALGAGATVALPKMAIPTVGWLGYFKDPEGNIFGVMQSDPNAK
jgi:predicted enzyme related to lactoylglutathione lyase